MTRVDGQRYVMDASVIVKWLLPEEGSDVAHHLRALARRGAAELLAPDLWQTEIANALWKRTRRAAGRMGEADAGAALALAARVPLITVPAASLLASAFELALGAGITVYDALYAALALREQAPLVTADVALHDALRKRWPQFGVVALADARG